MAFLWAILITIVTVGIGFLMAQLLGIFKLPDGSFDTDGIAWLSNPLQIVCILVVASRLRTNPIDVLALRFPTRAAKLILMGLAIAAAVFLILFIAGVAVPTFVGEDFLADANPNQDRLEQSIHRTGLVGNLILLGLIAPVSEEMLFRGLMLLSFFNTRLWFWGGAVITALAFALLHNPTASPLINAQYFAMGIACAAALRSTGSLWPAIVIHVLKNCIAVLAVSLS